MVCRGQSTLVLSQGVLLHAVYLISLLQWFQVTRIIVWFFNLINILRSTVIV